MHHIYRKAKKFKLQYDEGTLENEFRDGGYFVADEFTGTAKRPLKANWWNYGNSGRKNWQLKYAPTIRHIKSRVGDNWDTIYSDICHVANKEKNHVRNFILDRVDRHVTYAREVNIIDNVPHCRSTWAYRLRGDAWTPMSAGELYVHPDTKILCRVPFVKKVVKEKQSNTRKFADGSVFNQKKNSYIRRIGCGITEEVVNYSWFKNTTEKYWGEESYSVWEFGNFTDWDYKNNVRVLVNKWERVVKWRPVLLTRDKFISASKKDIKKYKLN